MIYALDMMADMVPFQLQERNTEPVGSRLARVILYIGTTLATALKDLIVLPTERQMTKLNFISRMKALESLYNKRELPAAHGGIPVSPIVENEVLRLSGV